MATVAQHPHRPYTPPPPPRRSGGRPWLAIAFGVLVALIAVLLVGAAIVWADLTQGLPNIAVLDDPNSLGFKTAQIFDRKGTLLWEINDPSGGKRQVVH